METDSRWMEKALEQARRAAAAAEVPVGAVVVVGDGIVAAAHNQTIAACDPTAHAEVVALRRAARRLGNHRLVDAVLYVTVEPCIMCAGAVVQARLRRVVYACRDPKAGALGSVYDIAADARLNHRFEVTAGVREEESRELLRAFFEARRNP